MERAHAEEPRVDSGVRLEVRRAWADLKAAQQWIEVAKASEAEAEESLRITQNRYAAGMSNVTDLLRNETAVFESRTRILRQYMTSASPPPCWSWRPGSSRPTRRY